MLAVKLITSQVALHAVMDVTSTCIYSKYAYPHISVIFGCGSLVYYAKIVTSLSKSSIRNPHPARILLATCVLHVHMNARLTLCVAIFHHANRIEVLPQ